MSGWDGPVSVVEDLDPEPEQPPGRFLLRDLVLGLLLLVGVLAFAGWQWWSQESRQSNYTNAVAALTNNDLDQARALFAGASGYRDADTRLADLDQRIAQRDSLYTTATAHISARDWPAALADLRSLRAIQPAYRDTSALERTTVTQVASGELDGSVALRDGPGVTPGLYYRRDSGWIYLPESDLESRIRGSGVGAFLVYDAPAPGSDGARRLMLANFNSSAPPSGPLPFDPAVYQDFRWNEHGLWAFRSGRYSTPGRAPVLNAMHGIEAAYMHYDTGIISTVSFQNTGGADGAVLADVDPTSDRYLVASWSGAQPWSSGILSNTVISLSVGSALDGSTNLLYSTTGAGIVSARLSHDGRYVLATSFTPYDAGDVYRLVLLSTGAGASPQQLDGVRARQFNTSGAPSRWISSTFIESGAYAGKILAAVFNYDHTHLRLYDPDLPEEPLLDVEVPGPEGLLWAVARSDESGLLVSGALASYSPSYGRSETQTVPLVEISPTGQVTQTGMVVDRYGYPYSVDRAPDHLALISALQEEDKYVWTVYTLPAASLGQSIAHPTVLYTQYLPGAIGITGPAPVIADGGLLTYLVNNALHARTYDGAVDVVLEEGIRALYPNRLLRDRYPVLR
jgi:hypothetical protein